MPPTTAGSRAASRSEPPIAADGAQADASSSGESGAEAPAATPRDAPDAGVLVHTRRVSLIDHSRWAPLGRKDDPFEDRPVNVECEPEAVAAEMLAGESAYGVDTGPCSYLTAHQLTQEYVAAGETLVVRLWHFELDAPSPGEAHAVVEVGGIRAVDERVPIPAPGGLIFIERVMHRGLPAGAPVYFHLHNHGENSWALVEISTGP